MSDCLIAINTPYNNHYSWVVKPYIKKNNDENKEIKFIYIKQITIYVYKYKKIDPIRDVR